jgi:hypothetical protein
MPRSLTPAATLTGLIPWLSGLLPFVVEHVANGATALGTIPRVHHADDPIVAGFLQDSRRKSRGCRRLGKRLATRRIMAPLWNWNIGSRCADCGVSLWEELHRAFAFGAHEYVCCECGEELGGVFDTQTETWIVPPAPDGRPAPVEHARHASRHS